MTQHGHSHATHHHHIEAGGEPLAAEARLVMEKAGEAWTDMRAQIFDAVAEIGKPASAYDIADIVSQKRGKRVAPNSVYRILDLFVSKNLVRRIESANAFVANSHPGCFHDCIFLICDQCGQAVHIDNDRLSHDVRAAAEATGFFPERPIIEVRGKCSKCQ